jgi:hypothetical protein
MHWFVEERVGYCGGESDGPEAWDLCTNMASVEAELTIFQLRTAMQYTTLSRESKVYN